jgi:MFS family permease
VIASGGGAIGLLLGGVLTEYIDWRSTLFVNLVFAAPAAAAALVLLVNERPAVRPKLDLAGAAPLPRACSRSSSASPTPRPTAGERR